MAATWASTARRTSRRSRGSGRSSTSARATWAIRSSTPRPAASGCTSATTGTSPRAGGRSAWPARGSCSTRRPPAGACPSTCGGSSSRPPRWPTSTSSARSTGSVSSRSATTTSTARPTSWTRAASSSATPRPTTRTRCWSGTWTWPSWPRSGTCGSSTATAAPTSTDRWCSHEPSASEGERESRAMSTTLITGGTVVTASGTQDADVLLEGEQIAMVMCREPGLKVSITADRLIDAAGKYVLPGGIDVHTHMEMPFGGTFSADTFETGTRAAAWGGTTTIIDFAVQAKGTSLLGTLDKWHAKADGNCAIDYGFHMIVSDVNDSTLKEMDACIAAGVNSFKMFMAYPGVFYATDGEILLAMQQAARSGATVMMHAENGIAIDQLVAQALAAGHTDPVYHGLSRPPELEGEATSRAITLAKVANCPLYIVHLSATQALEAVAAARDTGQNVFAETCPQYLFLSLDDLARPDFEGAKFVASPPLRPKDHQDSLWKGLRTNDLSVVSTDHCPFCFKDQKELGRGDFSKIPNGMPGVEHRIDLLHQGVAAGQMSLPRWVEVASTTPARMFGLYPRKGVIAAGSDADIVIYDPRSRQTLSAATHHMNVDYSAYEGLDITGRVVTTLSRGRVVIDDGQYLGSTSHGTFLARGLNQYLL